MTGVDFADKSIADLATLAGAHAAILIEGAEAASERALFHLYDLMRERGGHLLFDFRGATGALGDPVARPCLAPAGRPLR